MVAAVGWARCRTRVRVRGARCVMVRAAVLISAARCLGRIARLRARGPGTMFPGLTTGILPEPAAGPHPPVS
jgi:hypothetical protein